MDMRHATNGIGVHNGHIALLRLDVAVLGGDGLLQDLFGVSHLRAACQLDNVRGCLLLAWVRLLLVYALVKWPKLAGQPFEAEGGDHIRCGVNDFEVAHDERAEPSHDRCAIDESKAFFVVEPHGANVSVLQRLRGWHYLTAITYFAFARRRQRDGGQWAEVSTRAQRSLARNERMNLRVEHVEQHLEVGYLDG